MNRINLNVYTWKSECSSEEQSKRSTHYKQSCNIEFGEAKQLSYLYLCNLISEKKNNPFWFELKKNIPTWYCVLDTFEAISQSLQNDLEVKWEQTLEDMLTN